LSKDGPGAVSIPSATPCDNAKYTSVHGIVVGLASMITGILSQLKNLLNLGQGDSMIAGVGTIANITDLFDIVNMIPPYFMQIAIGIYIIQIIFILTGALVTIDSGEDKLRQTHNIARNLKRGFILYFIAAFISIVALVAFATG